MDKKVRKDKNQADLENEKLLKINKGPVKYIFKNLTEIKQVKVHKLKSESTGLKKNFKGGNHLGGQKLKKNRVTSQLKRKKKYRKKGAKNHIKTNSNLLKQRILNSPQLKVNQALKNVQKDDEWEQN